MAALVTKTVTSLWLLRCVAARARTALLICGVAASPLLAHSQEEESAGQEEETESAAEGSELAFDASSLRFSQGNVEIEDGLAKMALGERYSYLGPEDTERVLVEAWGNPPSGPTLGMIFPAGMGPLDEESWAVVIEYQDDGYVSDDDAKDLDYAEMLEQMQEQVRESNEARREAGYGGVELVDWAEPPHYDASTHKLYWAK